jgi:hypothetical protein
VCVAYQVAIAVRVVSVVIIVIVVIVVVIVVIVVIENYADQGHRVGK